MLPLVRCSWSNAIVRAMDCNQHEKLRLDMNQYTRENKEA